MGNITKDPILLLEIIRDIDNHKDELILYDFITEEEKIKAIGYFKEKDESNKTFKFHLKEDESIENIKKILANKDRVTLFNKRRALSFNTTINDNLLDKSHSLILNFPEGIVEFDRRETKRVLLGNPIIVNVSTDLKKYRKNVYDLGEGGFSILFGKTEVVDFVEKKTLSNCLFYLGRNELAFDCEVVKVFSIKPYEFENFPYGGTRVSFKFVNLHENIRNVILLYMGDNDIFSS